MLIWIKRRKLLAKYYLKGCKKEHKKMKKILATILIGVLAVSLTACAGESTNGENATTDVGSSVISSEASAENIENVVVYEDTFTGLVDYIVENGGKSTFDDQSCYMISFELDDYYSLGAVEFYAMTESDISACETICIKGSTYHYYETSQDFATLVVNKDGSFQYECDWMGPSVHNIFTYEVTVGAQDYTTETEFPCYIYDGETYELKKVADNPEQNNYGRNTDDVNNILDRAAISLATVGLSLDSLGFVSYEPDMERAEKNNSKYEISKGSNSGNSDSDKKDTVDYDMPEDGESFSDYVQRVDPELYDAITERYDALTGN